MNKVMPGKEVVDLLAGFAPEVRSRRRKRCANNV
jgi:hypothetical protein